MTREEKHEDKQEVSEEVHALMEKYWDLSMGGHPDLEQFVKDASAGRHGPATPEALGAFLREVEATTIANIETKAGEGGPFAAMREQMIEETRRQVQDLITAYGAPQT